MLQGCHIRDERLRTPGGGMREIDRILVLSGKSFHAYALTSDVTRYSRPIKSEYGSWRVISVGGNRERTPPTVRTIASAGSPNAANATHFTTATTTIRTRGYTALSVLGDSAAEVECYPCPHLHGKHASAIWSWNIGHRVRQQLSLFSSPLCWHWWASLS